MTPRESPRHIEYAEQSKPISIEEAVRRIRILADLREKKKQTELLNEQEERLLPALERYVDAWLTNRLTALAIPLREMPRFVALWIYEGAQKKKEQKDYEENEWQWLEEEKKKPDARRDRAYADRLSVYCILMEDAALARKWLVEQNKILYDKDAPPLERTNAREALEAVRHELEQLKERPHASVDASAVEEGVAMMKKSKKYHDLFDRFRKLLKPKDRFRAQLLIREIYSELKKVYNGKVPEEAYNTLVGELEVKLREVSEAYDAELDRIRRDLERRKQKHVA